MIEEFNNKLDFNPFGMSTFLADIIEYDGPVLSEYQLSDGCVFKYWVDSDNQAIRWLLFKVSERNKLRYYARLISLKELIESSSGEVYVFEDEYDSGDLCYFICKREDLSNSYKPSEQSYLPDDIKIDGSEFSILIEDEWSMDEIKEVFKISKQIYSYISGIFKSNITSSTLPSAYGLRGASFFNSLAEKNPFFLNSVSYASPGYIKADGDKEVLRKLNESFIAFEDDFKKIKKSYNLINSFYSLVKDKNDYDAIKKLYNYNSGMQSAYKDFSRILPGHDDIKLSITVVEEVDRLLMARAYYRRLLALKNLKDEKGFQTIF